jgi:hypothetical protein
MRVSQRTRRTKAKVFRSAGALSTLALAGLSIGVAPAAHAQSFNVEVIMNGLNSPRGLAFDQSGALYVAESGTGGNGATIPGGEGPVSYGATGSVTRYSGGVQQRVLTGLPSLASQAGTTPGASATGISDIVFDSTGQAYGIMGLGANPAERTTLTNAGAPGNSFGQLVRLTVDGTNAAPVNFADIAGFVGTNNPDGSATPDSNPYALVSRQGGGFAVTDAGANALFGVTSGGVVSTLSVFGPQTNPLSPGLGGPTFQSVPTALAQAANGSFYVGQLTGFPFPAGGANIYSVPAAGGTPTILATGFTNIMDMIVGADGNLYVLQLSTNGLAGATGPGPGQLIQVNPLTGTKTTLLSSPLFLPGGLTQGADGSFYVSNLSTAPGGGQVLRITAVTAPEPGTLALLGMGLLGGVGVVARRRRITR